MGTSHFRFLAVLGLGVLAARAAGADCSDVFKKGHLGKCPDQLGVHIGPDVAKIPKDAAYDTDCGTDVDLGADGGPLAHVKTQDQDGAGICYAEAASTLVDLYRFSHGDTNYDHQTSAVALAIGAGVVSNRSRWLGPKRTSIESGGTCGPANYALSSGSCDKRAVLEHAGDGDIKYFITAFGAIYGSYQKWLKDRSRVRTILNGAFGDGERLRQEGQHLGETVAEVQNCMRDVLKLPDDVVPGPSVLEAAFKQDDPMRFLQAAVTCACDRQGETIRTIGASSCIPEDFLSKPDAPAVARRLHALVGAGKPAGISLCANVISNPDYSGVRSGDRHWYGDDNGSLASDCGNHSVVVVGQRRDSASGKCQFKIRNSWGATCPRWCTATPHEEPVNSGVALCANSGWSCDRETGDTWVNADALSRNAFGVEHLE